MITKQIDISTAAAALGAKGGKSKSPKKQRASRRNGKRPVKAGSKPRGRPRKTQGDDGMYPKTMTISRGDYAIGEEYNKAYQEAVRHYDYRVKVDDGNGGTGWKFFESADDMRVWKQQK